MLTLRRSHMAEQHWDSIIIGAGPISILEASFLSSKGKSVLVVDSRNRIGGAWGTVQYPNHPEIEIGCHIWDRAPDVLDFLKQRLNLELMKMAPSPMIRKGNRSYAYDLKRSGIATRNTLKLLARLKFGQWLKNVNSPRYRFSLFPRAYYYPKLGAIEVLRGLENIVKKEGLTVKLEAQVKNIVIGSENRLTLASGEELTFDELVITSTSELASVDMNGDKFESTTFSREENPAKYVHFHLKVKDPSPTHFSYIRVMSDELVHRFSDMSEAISEHLESDERLLCAGVHQSAFEKANTTDLPNELLKKLQDYGYASANAVLQEANHNVYETTYQNKEAVDRLIAGGNGAIRQLYSTNLTFSVYQQLKRWKEGGKEPL